MLFSRTSRTVRTILTAAFCASLSLSAVPNTAHAFSFSEVFSSIFGDDDKFIDTVKNGVLSEYTESKTIGSAFDIYSDCDSSTMEWAYEKGSADEDLVVFKCTLVKSPAEYREMGEGFVGKAVVAGIGILGMTQMLSGSENYTEADIKNAEKQVFNVSSMDMTTKFAISKVDQTRFEHTLLEVHVVFADGRQVTKQLPTSDIETVFNNQPLLSNQLSSQGNNFALFVTDMFTGYLQAKVEDSQSFI